MRKFINKILNVPKLILTIWIILWVILILLLVLKFCFGIWYPIVVDNESFINICNFIDENKWLNNIIMLLFYELSTNVLFLTCIGKKMYSKWYIALIVIIINIPLFFLKLNFNFIGIISEILILLIAIIINIKRNTFKNNVINILTPIILYILLNLWQFTMLVVRSVDGLVISELPSLIYIILQVDYYIFIIITYMEVVFMGALSWGWFWSKDVTVLKAEKEKELAKKNPDMDKVTKIENRILELEGK